MQIEQMKTKGLLQHAHIGGAQEPTPYETGVYQKPKAKPGAGAKGIVTGSAPQTKSVTYTKPEQEEEASVFDEIQNEAAGKDAVLMKNEMVVGANKTTPEQVEELEEDGFSLPDTDIKTIVTETDKIQAQLAKAGKDTSYFTGALSEEQLLELAGSAALAAQYQSALTQAQALEPLDEGAVKYMLDNDLEPTIGNLYYAQFNGSREPIVQPDSAFDEETITEQIRQVALAAGLEPTAETIAAGKWLAANELAVTPENMAYMNALQELTLPLTDGETAAAMQAAVAAGKTPADACLIEAYSAQARAEAAVAVIGQTTDADLAYLLAQGQELTVKNLREAHWLIESGAVQAPSAEWLAADGAQTGEHELRFLEARRMLEETRLVMTAEANLGLLKRGIQIDLAPLEQLVEGLRQQEQSYYKNLLEADGSTATQEQIDLFQQTVEKTEQLKWMPAYALGSARYSGTSESLYEAGAAMQAKLNAAGESYETLMTAPRRDMGDSIQQAFRNVDDILQELGMEQTEANQRAVRILAYNQMELTVTSITEMKLADLQVQDAFESLKPAVVREMIREGINPLRMELSELNAQAEKIREQIGAADETEKFSEYLWKLEKNQSITPEERASYIGVYRLIHQVVAGDGAAVGALVQQGAPLTMENLLRAMRSKDRTGMDYTVDDAFGGIEKKSNGTSISEQIEAAYQTECFKQVQKTAQEPEQFSELFAKGDWKQMTPEQMLECLQQTQTDETTDRAYSKELLERLQTAAQSESPVYEMLETYQVPVTVNHVLAMQQMLTSPNDALRRLFGMPELLADGDEKQALMDALAEAKEDILQKLGEGVQTPEELADAQKTLAEVAEHCGQTVLREGMTHMDVRQYQMMTAQLHLNVQMAKEERYQIPIVTSDGVTGVNVRIVRGSEKKGSLYLTMDSAAYGKVAAELQVTDKGIRGYFASDSRAGADRLQREKARIDELLSAWEQRADGSGQTEIHMVYSAHIDLVKFELSAEKSASVPDGEARQVQTKELYGIAENVIRFLQEGLTKEAASADI